MAIVIYNSRQISVVIEATLAKTKVDQVQTFADLRSDKKMDRLMSGVGDGCDSCLTPRHLWTDEEMIEEGFPKNRTLENIRETWASLRKRKDGEVFKTTGDYETRQGLCREPVTLRDTLSFTVTHKVG